MDTERHEANKLQKIQESGQEDKEYFSKCDQDMAENSSAESYLLQKLDDLCQLEFIVGESETLHQVFPPNSIDMVVSIESSHCYGDLDAFFKSNYLMLKNPSIANIDSSMDLSEQDAQTNNDGCETGYFLYADHFDVDELDEVSEKLSKYFNFIKSENITANVLHSLELDRDSRKERIYDSAEWYMKPWCSKYFTVFLCFRWEFQLNFWL